MNLAGTVLYIVQKNKQIMIMKYLFILIIAVAAFKCSPKLSPDAGWGHQQWVLVEMKGVPVQQSGGRKMHMLHLMLLQKGFREMEVVTRSMEIIMWIKRRSDLLKCLVQK